MDCSVGMEYLCESANIKYHGDLALRNYLLSLNRSHIKHARKDSDVDYCVNNPPFVAKISDFGHALPSHKDEDVLSKTVPWKESAPEVLNRFILDSKNQDKYAPQSFSSDVWSFGLSIWELYERLSGASDSVIDPFPAAKAPGDFGELLLQGKRPIFCESSKFQAPSKLKELCSQCWEYSEKKRPTFSQIRIELQEVVEIEYSKFEKMSLKPEEIAVSWKEFEDYAKPQDNRKWEQQTQTAVEGVINKDYKPLKEEDPQINPSYL